MALELSATEFEKARSAPRTAPAGFPWIAPCAALALFATIWFEAKSREVVAGSDEHNERVQALAEVSLTNSVGDWIGKVVPAPPAVVKLLRSNVLVARDYSNLRTRESASVLFVHCGDARDLLGHYPPACYPAHGQELKSAEPRDWTIGGTTITGMRYRFVSRAGPMAPDDVVDNFMVLPNGQFGRDMDMATRVSQDRTLRRFGAAEVQVVTSGEMSEERRDEVFRTLLEPALPLFKGIRNEVNGD
jgi:hypothetical protein